MWSRAGFVVITAFWVTMNVLLWCSESSQHNPSGSLVAAEAVWQKVLTAPDDSSLDIIHYGRKIGFCRWPAGEGFAHVNGTRGQFDGERSSQRASREVWRTVSGIASRVLRHRMRVERPWYWRVETTSVQSQCECHVSRPRRISAGPRESGSSGKFVYGLGAG